METYDELRRLSKRQLIDKITEQWTPEYRKYKATFHASTSAGATRGSPNRASLAQSAQAAGRRRLALRASVG